MPHAPPHRRANKTLIAALVVYGVMATGIAGYAAMQAELWRPVARVLGIAAKPREHTAFSTEMTGHLRRLAANAADGGIVFLGDSLLQGLDIRTVTCDGLNLAIGGETTARLLARLGDYRSLGHADGIVLLIGINDFRFRSPPAILANYAALLERLPRAVPLLIIGVLPVDARLKPAFSLSAINHINESVRGLCTARPNCRFVDAAPAVATADGNLRADLHEGDGLHLNATGYHVLAGVVRPALATLVPRLVLPPVPDSVNDAVKPMCRAEGER